ncbi:glycosyltransferase family 39 protein [Microbulbifer elongatus]|uniref:glycosyltransferase family 39 protein n=1 Tax=Microbulbifer elongatus TaxID=86173 RepID=UPI001E5AE037|nr:glycosyltransferase family 39 protein [Microbulbifer elongatus]
MSGNLRGLASGLPPQLRQLDRRWLIYAGLYFLIALGIWLRVEHIFTYNPLAHIWSDPQRHWEQGTATLRTDPMTLTDPVMYQLYIGVLAKLTLKEPLLIAFYTALLACLTPWIWYRFARELLPSRMQATAVWAAISLLPSWIGIYSYFMQETLLLPLLGAALYASWRCRRKQTLASFLLMVVLWTCAGLTRGIAIPLAAVVTTWLWLVQPQKLAKAGFSLLVLTLLMGPLAYRSYAVMHMVSPHGIGQLVALYLRSGKREIHVHYLREDGAQWNYWFGSPSTGEKPLAPLSDWTTTREGAVHARIEIANGAEDWRAALARYPMTMERYLHLTGENLVYLFFGSSWPDNNRARLIERLNHHSRWLWAPLCLLLMVGTLCYWRRLREVRLFAVLVATWLLVQGVLPIAVNEGRYRKPLEGFLLVQGVALAGVLRRRRHLEAGGGLRSTHTQTDEPVADAGDKAALPLPATAAAHPPAPDHVSA